VNENENENQNVRSTLVASLAKNGNVNENDVGGVNGDGVDIKVSESFRAQLQLVVDIC